MKPTNFFVLTGATVRRADPKSFELVMSNGERRSMQTADETDCEQWIAALKDAIQSQQKKRETQQLDADVVASALKDGGGKIERNEKKMRPEDFNFIKVLGKGNYGKVKTIKSLFFFFSYKIDYPQVMLATFKNDPTNQYYAVKVIKKSGLIDDESLEHVLAENRVLQSLNHPFLVKLYYSFQTEVLLAQFWLPLNWNSS